MIVSRKGTYAQGSARELLTCSSQLANRAERGFPGTLSDLGALTIGMNLGGGGDSQTDSAMLRYGTLVKRGKRWAVRIRDDETGHYSWRSTGTGDRHLAEMWRRGAEAREYERFAHPERREITLDAGLQLWIEELSSRLRPATLMKLESSRRTWLKAWGDASLRSLSSQRIEGYLGERPIANSTRNEERALLKWFFRWALSRGYVDSDPTIAVSRWPVEVRAIRTIPVESLPGLLAHCSPLIRAVVTVAVETGLRQQTLLSIDWEHVDLERGYLHIPAKFMKSNREFQAPLSPAALEALRGARTSVTGRVFPLSHDSVRRGFQRAAAKCGLRDLRFHDCRRTFLTNCRRRGVPMEVAMALSDHRDLKVVLACYRAIDSGELLQAVGRSEVPDGGDSMRVVRS